MAAFDGERAKVAIILEVQINEDPDKQWSMVLYRAGIRYQHRCSAWNLLFSPQRRVLAWARNRLFAREPELAPYVITPEMIPPCLDLELAMADYASAVLAVVLYSDDPDAVVAATVAIQALLRLAPPDVERYIQLVADSVTEDIMQQVREHLAELFG